MPISTFDHKNSTPQDLSGTRWVARYEYDRFWAQPWAISLVNLRGLAAIERTKEIVKQMEGRESRSENGKEPPCTLR